MHPHAQDECWELEVVDPTMSYCAQSDRGLVLDAAGHPHIAYGGDFLYYAHFDGTTWHRETVDVSRGVGGRPAIALGPSGLPHIGYYDAPRDCVKHAYKDAEGWHIEAADDTEAAGGCAIGVDSTGGVHLSYRGPTATDGLLYAYKSGSGWSIETIDATQHNIGYDPSLVVDAEGRPHVSYQAVGEGSTPIHGLRYAYRDAEGWHAETAYDPGGVESSLALDSDGWPHISCRGGGMVYVFKDETGWHSEIVDTSTAEMQYTSIALDADGNAHISWTRYFRVRYACRDSAGWTLEIVGDGSMYTSIALDSEGSPRITYEESSYGGLQYATRTDEGWSSELVQNRRYNSSYTSIALDSDDHPHISYRDWGDNDAVMYATSNGTSWSIETVDDSRLSYGRACSIAVDSGGYPHISYSDDHLSHNRLRYARKDPTGWHIETVDEGSWTDDIGENSSLVLDDLDRPHIAYTEGRESLKYAYFDGEWHVECVDDNDDAYEAQTSIKLDSTGSPHIAYITGANEQLGYAYKEDGTWHLEIPSASEDSARDPSLALSPEGWPHISYAGTGVRYAYKDGTGWHFEDVAGSVGGDRGGGTCIALDTVGSPHISYFHESNCDLMYASRDTAGWTCSIVDGYPAYFGFFPVRASLAMDRSGRPRIGYTDGRCFDLWYAYDSSEPPPAPTPAAFRLTASGSLLSDGTVRAAASETGAADVAEWVAVSEYVEAGDVVELDPTRMAAYRPSQTGCSALVAGVISTEPGIVLGEATSSDSHALLALSGIVPVKVTSEGGPILPGDLLVTSSTPGHAMRWGGEDSCLCSLVGKALEPMADCRGVILVLLTAH